MAHHQGDGARVGGDVSGLGAGGVGGIALDGLELEVPREHLHGGRVGHGEVGHQLVAGLPGGLERIDDADGVAGQEACDVHQQATIGQCRLDLSGPDHGRGEGFAGGGLLGGRRAGGAEPEVLELSQDSATDPAEGQHLGVGDAGPVEPNRRGTEAGAQRGDIDIATGDALAVRGRQGQQDAALGGIDIDRDQALLAGEAGDGIGRRRRGRLRLGRPG